MTNTEFILLNLKEIRRRSIKLWEGLPRERYFWKPDKEAMTAIEMIRHVLGADHGWNIIINQGDMSSYISPWENRPFVSLQDELEFAKPYRQQFLESIRQFSADDLANKEITHPGNGKVRLLGDYLLRIGYHESVHAGQFISYLRMMQVERPFIWD
ncbi:MULTISPECIES: DinB family protein [unclassified Aureispira]|uniref:DinB family protein n=1 Tax=unclassified Aureispira TaxID=2649989 RepID=UPI0006962BC8|nr:MULTISPECIES: DinB family protein [unclassified Aureispira]WMX16740.1 DinB family protein [Aureispira sp. CCB-E]